MIIKMVNEFKLIVFHLRAQTRCKAVHARGFTAGQQNRVSLRVTSRAVGRGPLGRGLLSAKPPFDVAAFTALPNYKICRILIFLVISF